MAEPLQLNDAVHVTRDARQLEGVISFLGSVSFTDGDDWVGVRLTGASIGMGKNDGSVEDVSYFTCPQNCGMFVRQAAVTKRSLTRLEELRLRRELASSSAGTTAPAPTAPAPTTSTSTAPATLSTPTRIAPTSRTSTPTPSRSSTPTPSATKTTTTTPPRGRVSAPTPTMSKLEELRLRRAALAEKKEGAVAAAAAATTTRTPAPSVDTASESVESSAVKPSPSRLTSTSTTTAQPPPQQPNLQPALDKLQVQVQELTGKLRAKEQDAASLQQMQPVLDKLQVQVQELTGKLRSKEQDAASLQQKLSQAEQEVHDARAQVMELEESAATAVIAASTSAPAEPVAAVPLTEITNDHIQEQLQEAFEEISNLKRSAERDQETNDMLSQELQEVRSNAKRELEREKEALVLQTDQLTRARSEVTTLQKEMQATSDQTVQRGTSDALHYKERAKLQAEISALKRKAEEAEKEKLDLDAAVEEVTLDKEQLQEEKEALEDRLEELKLDTETAQIEVEELRMELEDTRASAERVTSFKDEATAEGADGGDNKAEELAQILTGQNARLREALIRLREQSSVEKMEVSRQLRAAEKDAEAGRALSSEVESSRAMKVTYEEQINDLKDMVEEGAAFEQMVEDLSDRVLSLEEDNISLQATLREMEESAELTAEMEEVQADELKEMARDLEGRDTIIRNLEEAIKMYVPLGVFILGHILGQQTPPLTLYVLCYNLIHLQAKTPRSRLSAYSWKLSYDCRYVASREAGAA
jgi:hypothetical protein